MSNLNSPSKVKGSFLAYLLMFCLVLFYFILVSAVSPEWIDSSVGAMAFALAKTINPYLMDRSIILAANPGYFIHCHVLASWVFIPFFGLLDIKAHGGRSAYKIYWANRNDRFGGCWMHLILLVFILGGMIFGMPFIVDIPTSRGARAIWVSAISVSAMLINIAISTLISYIYMTLYSEYKRGFK